MFTVKSISRILSVLLVLVLILSVTPAYAAEGILYVTPDGTGDCSTWTAACTLQTALNNATSGDEIWVTAGIYKPTSSTNRAATFQLKSDVAVYGGFNGTEATLNERNITTNITILSGDLNSDDIGFTNNGENSYHVVIGANEAKLDGVTVTSGNANASAPNNIGGGMFNYQINTLILSNIIFSTNSAQYGAGMYNEQSNLILVNVIFTGNSASYDSGGMLNYYSDSTLTNVTFSYNSAINSGGMSNINSAPILTNVTFDNNSATHTGGMSNSSSVPILRNVTFSNNSSNGNGGGMSNSTSDPALMNVSFIGNSAGGKGGGMYNAPTSFFDTNPPTNLTNVTFKNNSAGQDGGGMYNDGINPVLINVTFNNNFASYNGGGMYNHSSFPTLKNVTFSDNFAFERGGGINNDNSQPQIRNTIFWGNVAQINGSQMYTGAGAATLSDSVVQDGCPVVSTTCTNIITIDPILGTIGNYGGFTETIELLAGSSAIDAGDNANCATADQRNYARPVDGDNNGSAICDIGAYEAGSIPLPTETITPTATATSTNTGTPTQTIIPLTGTFTFTPTETSTPSPTETDTASPAVTETPTPTITITITDIATLTHAPTTTPTKTGTKTSTPTQAPLTLISIAAQDGWILESSETSNMGGTMNVTAGTLQLGDDKTNRQYRTVLSFNTAGLPDHAVILSAVLKIKQNGLQVGSNPFNVLGTLWADIQTGPFGSTILQLKDFSASASASKIGSFNKMPLNGWYLNALNATGRSKINKTGITQFRLYFAKDDNNNFTADYMKFQSGNASSNQPVLTITYSLLVNINTASIELLQTLPGIGPTIAQNIVNYRLLYGRYTTIDDLLKVPGIGPSLLEALRKFITI